ncbi:MAG: sugar transferase [Clostridia bacterium]|nr:sugar transferase [Clostridia bacterium]
MYKKSEQSWLKHLDFIVLDALSAQLALVLAYAWRIGWLERGRWRWVYQRVAYRNLAIWMALFCVLAAVMFNTMHDVLKRRWTTEVRRTLTQCGIVFAAVVVYLFSIKDSEYYSRLVLWVTLALYILIAFSTRMLWKRFLRSRLGRGGKGRAMLLITDEESASGILKRFSEHPLEQIVVCGIVLADRDAVGEKVDGIDVVANLQDAAQYICREWIDEVYFGLSDHTPSPSGLIDKCRQMGVTLHLQILPPQLGKQAVEKVAGMTVITNSINIASPLQLMIKRLMDILGGAVLSLMALVAIVLVGPIIKLRSPGPILFRQQRIGQNGKRFMMYKIRSMYLDADAHKQELMAQNRMADGMMFKLDFDPRIIGNVVLPDGTRKTGIGEFIRRYSIDELPQGFNILLGQMSLVGTRPPTVDEWEKYELHHRARLSTKPGLTGLWQVSGRSEITDFEEITRLDTEYIENWSIGLDIRILFRTVWTVLGHRGAM